jgi:hypothetical protein
MRFAAVFAGILLLGHPSFAQEEELDEGITPQGTLEELRKKSGNRVSFNVLKMIESQTVSGLLGFVRGDGQFFQKVAIVEAGDVRAILIPGATAIRAGMALSLNVQFLGKFEAPPRSGLPNPVAVYRESAYKDTILYNNAYAEALEREIGKLRGPGKLKRYQVPWERVGEITPDTASRGLVNPMDPKSVFFFTRLPEISFEVVDSLFVDGNYRVRLINRDSGMRAVLNLPWNSRESLRGAAKGTLINATGWVEAIRVDSSGVERGQLFLNEGDFPDFLFGKVRTIG